MGKERQLKPLVFSNSVFSQSEAYTELLRCDDIVRSYLCGEAVFQERQTIYFQREERGEPLLFTFIALSERALGEGPYLQVRSAPDRTEIIAINNQYLQDFLFRDIFEMKEEICERTEKEIETFLLYYVIANKKKIRERVLENVESVLIPTPHPQFSVERGRPIVNDSSDLQKPTLSLVIPRGMVSVNEVAIQEFVDFTRDGFLERAIDELIKLGYNKDSLTSSREY